VTTPRMRLVTDVTAAEFEQLAREDHVRGRLERLLAIEAAAQVLVDKVFGPDGHEHKGFHHIKIGAIAPLRDAIHSERNER
jgi:hypothetical protein